MFTLRPPYCKCKDSTVSFNNVFYPGEITQIIIIYQIIQIMYNLVKMKNVEEVQD